jgi:hypothetical protein
MSFVRVSSSNPRPRCLTRLSYVQVNSSVSWRLPIAFQMVPTMIGFLILLDLPDTPRWYYYVGRVEEGDAALCKIYARPLTDPEVSASKLGILIAIELEKNAPRLRFSDFFWDRSDYKVVRRLTICFGILSIQQLMGQNFRKWLLQASVFFKEADNSSGTCLRMQCKIVSVTDLSAMFS